MNLERHLTTLISLEVDDWRPMNLNPVLFPLDIQSGKTNRYVRTVSNVTRLRNGITILDAFYSLVNNIFPLLRARLTSRGFCQLLIPTLADMYNSIASLTL